MVNSKTATDTKNRIQYKFLFLFCISIGKNFGKNRRGLQKTKEYFLTPPLLSFHGLLFLFSPASMAYLINIQQ
jgi:hypothetical protein